MDALEKMRRWLFSNVPEIDRNTSCRRFVVPRDGEYHLEVRGPHKEELVRDLTRRAIKGEIDD